MTDVGGGSKNASLGEMISQLWLPASARLAWIRHHGGGLPAKFYLTRGWLTSITLRWMRWMSTMSMPC